MATVMDWVIGTLGGIFVYFAIDAAKKIIDHFIKPKEANQE